MTNPELNAAIATRIMGWTLIDRLAMGWGEGSVVWSTGDACNPTWQWFHPSTELADARKAARKAGVKVASNDPGEICRVLLGRKDEMALEDTPELRRLVHRADQRRARYCALPVPTVAMTEDDDPRAEEMDDRLYDAEIAMMTAETELLDYLIAALDMRSERRS